MRRHHDHAVGEINRLGDVVGDVDDGLARLAPDVGEQPLHVVARQRIKRRERLVHQQHSRIVGERARDRDALLHSAGQVMRIGVGELLKLDQLELLVRDLLALLPWHALHLEAERDIASAVRHGNSCAKS